MAEEQNAKYNNSFISHMLSNMKCGNNLKSYYYQYLDILVNGIWTFLNTNSSPTE